MSRAIRFHSGLPLKFWGDCVLAAVHITNRLPSSVIQNKTPYEILYNKKPKYKHLKAFGCLAIASNPNNNKDKFEPRGVPCIFIGYPITQKGYKLYNLLTQTVFVSRDVRFYESIFPYHIFHSTSADASTCSNTNNQPSLWIGDDPIQSDDTADDTQARSTPIVTSP